MLFVCITCVTDGSSLGAEKGLGPGEDTVTRGSVAGPEELKAQQMVALGIAAPFAGAQWGSHSDGSCGMHLGR